MKKTLLSGNWNLYYFEQTTGKETSPAVLDGKPPCRAPAQTCCAGGGLVQPYF